jgi:hypothetical protein
MDLALFSFDFFFQAFFQLLDSLLFLIKHILGCFDLFLPYIYSKNHEILLSILLATA